MAWSLVVGCLLTKERQTQGRLEPARRFSAQSWKGHTTAPLSPTSREFAGQAKTGSHIYVGQDRDKVLRKVDPISISGFIHGTYRSLLTLATLRGFTTQVYHLAFSSTRYVLELKLEYKITCSLTNRQVDLPGM